MIISGRAPHDLRALHEKYGEVVRIAPDELSFINSDAWKAIYGTRTGHSQKKKDLRFYTPTANGAPNIIQSSDADHSRFRRLLSHAFSDSSLRGQEHIIKGYIDLFIQRLREVSEGGNKTVDMVKWYNFITFDIIGDLAFGEPFDCLRNSNYHQWVLMVIGWMKVGAYANIARRLPGWKFVLPLITPKKVIEQKNAHYRLTEEKVKARLQKSNERPDFFGNILKQNGSEKGFSFEELITNASALIIAGSETTATLLAGVTYLLLKNPQVLAKLQDEVRTAIHAEDEITFDTCNQLPYLQAVLTETLRMYPPVPSGLPRIVDAQGDIIAGHWVPGGTVVSVPHLATYYSAKNFKYPESFIPERHLNDARFEHDNKEALQPFSFGPRNCIGRNLAYVEMRIILACMVYNFDMQLDQPDVDWMNHDGGILWDKPPLELKLIPRI
ncbi:hypothetical protein N7495_003398 [Penicillium taxi]|uniref:uncharacterized protein n=1 Tax=Penicillium taxi TaxID=168475 RepID=UPI0025458B22|nr:uncharacterized protein N7495_003398 [Penicillium taxi]KAJ5902870.1 hypothetical protein N7495_003398 [Penicillium taxi]